MDVSVIVPSYETRSLLLACLDSIEGARRAHPEIELEVIVVDNGSRDASAWAVQERFPDTRLFVGVCNRGFAAAVNRGWREAQGRVVVLVNSDVEIDPDAFAIGLGLFDEEPEIGVAGAALEHADGRAQRSVHRLPGLASEMIPDWLIGGGRGRGRGRTRRATGDRTARGPSSGNVEWVDAEAVRGAVFFLRASLLEKVGTFDEGYFFFLEETDYCARVRGAGYRVVQVGALRALHRLGASSKQRVPLATRIEYHRALYRFLDRHRGRVVARAARILRMLRGALTVIGLTLASPFSPRIRARRSERWGLLLWHLRGCPEEPGLAHALAQLPVVDGDSGRP